MRGRKVYEFALTNVPSWHQKINNWVHQQLWFLFHQANRTYERLFFPIHEHAQLNAMGF